MSTDREEKIRSRAHQIWEREGGTHGRHQEHWAQATHEIDNEDAAGRAASGRLKVTTADDPTRPSSGAGQPSGNGEAGRTQGGAAGVSSGIQRGGTMPGGGAPAQGSSGSAAGRNSAAGAETKR
jgi:hypothetical protein